MGTCWPLSSHLFTFLGTDQMDWMSLAPHYLSASSHSSCFCWLKHLQSPLSFLYSWCSRADVVVNVLYCYLKSSWLVAEPCLILCIPRPSLSWGCPVPLVLLWWLRESEMGSMERDALSSGSASGWTPVQPGKGKERFWYRQLCWVGGRGQGSGVLFGLCSWNAVHLTPSEHNCRDEVGAAWKSQGWHNFQLERKGTLWGPEPVSLPALCCAAVCECSATPALVRNEKFQGLLSTLWIFTVAQRKVI